MRSPINAATAGTLVAAALAISIPLWTSVHAQDRPPANGPSFEVASVKLNKSGNGFVQIGGGGAGRFVATNTPLRLLIRVAYQIQDFQIVDAPAWITNDRFDINAKTPDGFQPGQTLPGQVGPMNLMLQALLAERFKLRLHNDAREMPIYALVVARSDGRLGPQLHASTVDCAAAAAAARGRAGTPPAPPPPGQRPNCGIRLTPGQMSGGGFPLGQLATTLSPLVQRVVVDHSGLSGNFDFDLTYTPEFIQQGPPPPAGQPALVNGAPVDPNGPSIYTAIQEQLGLKLDSQKGPVDVLVVDSVEHPTDD